MSPIEDPPADVTEPAYRSGSAARLAGIPVETLRVWERRYGVVGPPTSPRGHRLYSAEDVRRLALIRQLVDLGNPIGALAALPLQALRDMRAAATAGLPAALGFGPAHPVRVAIVGSALAQRLSREGGARPSLDIVGVASDAGGAVDALRGVAAEIVAVEMPTLQPDSVDTIDGIVGALGARHAIVAYRFAPSAVIGSLRNRGYEVLRSPIDVDAFERLCRDVTHGDAHRATAHKPVPPSHDVPDRRFDDQTLSRISQALVTLNCECPHHVVELLLGLGSFERYSAECANRTPADAELHRYLQRVAGSARAMFEDALVRVARAEGLALPPHRSETGVGT